MAWLTLTADRSAWRTAIHGSLLDERQPTGRLVAAYG